VIARVSQLRVAPIALQAGNNQFVDPTKYSNQSTEFTFGFNWHWNAWVRLQLNVEHAQFNDPVLLGTTRPSGPADRAGHDLHPIPDHLLIAERRSPPWYAGPGDHALVARPVRS
jgi:hypothetical protein